MSARRQQKLTGKLVLLFLLLFGLGAMLTVYAALRVEQSLFVWLGGGYTLIVLVVFLFTIRMLQRYTQDVITQLSDIIGALYDLREEELVSVLDDDLLSKLQAQVIKLIRGMRIQQEKLSMERDEIKSLISDISHQLKTPLANLEMYCTFLQDKGLSDEQRATFSGHVQSQLDRLSWLLKSLIKMSRLESGIIQLQVRPSNLSDTLLTAVKQVHEKARQKGITIDFATDSQHIMLAHDVWWTTEALFNLIDNAVKYTARGGHITIRIQRYELYARIDIEDTGTGLSEAEIPRIFARFYRGENSRDTEGVGIGLYLSREIISKQDGYIKVSSKVGQGSVFSVFIRMDGDT